MTVFSITLGRMIALFLIVIARPFAPEPLFLSVLVLFSAMPVPAPPLSLISNYGGNLLWATRTVVMTTLLSVITIPVVSHCFL